MSSHSAKLAWSLTRRASRLVTAALTIAWLGVIYLLASPMVLHDAWEDWRFHNRRHPASGYTLWAAIKLQSRAFLEDLGR